MTVMLLDSASMYFRAFYGVPESITGPDGRPNNAVRGFLDMTARLVSTRRPDRLVACLDEDWRPAFRVGAVASYKAHRVAPGGGEQIPDALAAQVPVLMEVLDALGLARIGVAGFEADDVIGTLADSASAPVEVVSGDRDLFQVVRDDPPVRVLYIARSVAKLEVVGPDEVAARYHIPGTAYVEFAVLRGDPSDGLPGVPGIGEKSAAALVTRYGSVAGMLAALDAGDDAFPPGARTRLLAARDYLAVAPAVASVRRDVPLPSYDDRLPAEPVDPEALVDLADRHGLDGPIERVLRALKAASDAAG